ncbi:MAG: CotH kinase family protein [Bacteroidaceae bacterium]|nr:CotH kinase family protein [Bacteroidaceae bacterium]
MLKHLFICVAMLFSFSSAVVAADPVWMQKDKCLFVQLVNGGMDAYELSNTSYHTNGTSLVVEFNGKTITYAQSDYKSYSTDVPTMPTMVSYGFKSKYNHELFADVDATISSTIKVDVNQIGHYLTASFELSDRKAVAYVGAKLQNSDVTRQNLQNAVTYTVTYPGYNMVTANGNVPFGNEYQVQVNWLVDNAINAGTSVARIDINIDGNVTEITNAMKDTYQNATFTLTGYGVFEDMVDVPVTIKGRGNSSWTDNTKKPYRLKFEKKQAPFGMTKAKSWVLLANAQNGSFLTNAIAHKLGGMIDIPYTNHSVPVDVYLSGQYKGTYMFTEHRSINANSVDIDDETSYLLELDANDKGDDKADVISADNADIYFNSSNISIPVVIKDPDLVDWAEEKGQTAAETRMSEIKTDFNKLTALLKNQSATADLESLVDLNVAARFILVNELVLNIEAGHPKSIFMWKENFWNEDGTTNSSAKMMFGPIWDFDWAFGYGKKNFWGTKYSYFDDSRTSTTWPGLSSLDGGSQTGTTFFKGVTVNNEFKRHYRNVWNEFDEGALLTELEDYIICYYNYAKSSFASSVSAGKDKSFDYQEQVNKACTWLNSRRTNIVKNLTTNNVDDLAHPTVGDTDLNDVLSVRDIAVVGTSNANSIKADVNGDNSVNTADMAAAAGIVANAGYLPSWYFYETPMASATLQSDELEISAGESATVSVKISSAAYTALQAEITMPEGMTIDNVTVGDMAKGKSVILVPTGDGKYRLLIYGTSNDTFVNGDELFALEVSLAGDAAATGEIVIEEIVVVDKDYNEQRLVDHAIAYYAPGPAYITLVDGEVYSGSKQAVYEMITYQRTFNSTNWQALYVPFEIDYNAVSDRFKIAEINNMHRYDDDLDGVVDRTVIEIFYLTEDAVTEPNVPYFIKPFNTGTQEIVVENAVLYPAEENSIDCSSVKEKFTFTGTYTGLSGSVMCDNGYYALSGGQLKYAASANASLGSYRWYMNIESRTASGAPQQSIAIREIGGATGVEEVEYESEEQAIYDLTGRRVEAITTSGIYIINGKKVFVK